jgi:hypothetical protein
MHHDKSPAAPELPLTQAHNLTDDLNPERDANYLTLDLRTLPQAGPRDLLPQPKRTF